LTSLFEKVKLKVEETKLWPRKLKRKRDVVVSKIGRKGKKKLKNQEVSS